MQSCFFTDFLACWGVVKLLIQVRQVQNMYVDLLIQLFQPVEILYSFVQYNSGTPVHLRSPGVVPEHQSWCCHDTGLYIYEDNDHLHCLLGTVVHIVIYYLAGWEVVMCVYTYFLNTDWWASFEYIYILCFLVLVFIILLYATGIQPITWILNTF